MNTNIFSRIELIFWNITIQALSYSSFVRSFLRRAHQLANGLEFPSLGILVGVSGMIGLFTGYMVYFLTVGLR